MEQYKQDFIKFMVESDVLKFGDFTLKSGRKSPFFMNAGAYLSGTSGFFEYQQFQYSGSYDHSTEYQNFSGKTGDGQSFLTSDLPEFSE